LSGYAVLITDTATGRTLRSEHSGAWTDATRFGWTEGNFACDCNRGGEFLRADGVDTDEMDDEEDEARLPCGHSRYSAVAVLPDGARVDLDTKRV
jgi:hypothetical protein